MCYAIASKRYVTTAGHLLGAVEAHFEGTGEVLYPAEQLELDSHVAFGRSTAATFDEARAAGRRLCLDGRGAGALELARTERLEFRRPSPRGRTARSSIRRLVMDGAYESGLLQPCRPDGGERE